MTLPRSMVGVAPRVRSAVKQRRSASRRGDGIKTAVVRGWVGGAEACGSGGPNTAAAAGSGEGFALVLGILETIVLYPVKCGVSW